MEHAFPATKPLTLPHLGVAHLVIFLVLYVIFALLTWSAMMAQTENDRRSNANVLATIGCVSGPFTGAIARQWGSCCLRASLELFPYCAVILVVGFAVQFVPLPFGRFSQPLRLTVWALTLFGWFAGGIVSLGHALS
jgi:hypothetical protein